MADRRDPFDILRENNPADPATIDPYSDVADALLASILATPRRRSTVRRRVVLVAVALLALAVGVAMTIALTQKDVTNMAITCYEAVTMESSGAGLVAEGVPEASACEQPWRDGVLTMEGVTPGEVPPLTACVTDLGGLAVFPTDDPMVCEELGLADPTPGQPTDHFETIAEMQEDVFDYVMDACRPIDEAQVVFREILDRHGLTDWTVKLSPWRPEDPCTSVAYDEEAKTITIVRISGFGGAAPWMPEGPRALAAEPVGSLEGLLQQQSSLDGPFAKLLDTYELGEDWHADVVYLPDNPPVLQSVSEQLSDDRSCLEVEFVYDEYVVTQERGCGRLPPIGVWEAPKGWFAAASGLDWKVLVFGPSEEGVKDLVDRLRPYAVLSRVEIPLPPADEQLVGRVEFEGDDLLVTISEPSCANDCGSAEPWFHVYNLDGIELIPNADYPAWEQCLLAEEESWTLAIAPARGSIAIETANGTETIVHDGDRRGRAVAFVPAGEADTVAILGEDGGETFCTATGEGDHRDGNDDPESATTSMPPLTTGTEIAIEPCHLLPPHPEDFSSQPFLATGCVQTPDETYRIARFYPDGFINAWRDEPLPDGECMLYGYRDGNSLGPCLDEPNGFAFSADAPVGDGYVGAVGLVSDDTTRVVAVTDRGDTIVAIPYERMVFLWWPMGVDLVSVVAETPSGEVDLLDLGP